MPVPSSPPAALGCLVAASLAAHAAAAPAGQGAVSLSAGVLRAPDTLVQRATNHVTSNRPGVFNGQSVNTLLGADRFYDAGYDGGGTIAANVEAGHVWNGHESLGHVSSFVNGPSAFGSTTADLFDRHATWVGQHIGGRATPGGGAFQTGIAPGTDLRSGALATNWNGSAYALGFGFDSGSFRVPYSAFFGTADVINSSWGFEDPAATGFFAVALDGYANQNPGTTFVTSAGNSNLDPVLGSPETVGAPAAGYNNLAVAALGNANAYDVVTGFSSRGPQRYSDPVNGSVPGVRAPVDIAAPGQSLVGAFYGGTSGGNNPTLTGSSGPAPANAPTGQYSGSIAGTSFAAPIVAGGVALLHDAQQGDARLSVNPDADDARVIKAVLLNSADKVRGTNGAAWDNGQELIDGVISTDQSLDFAVGAGRMNLDRAFDQYVTAGTADVPGLVGGVVTETGWDFGVVAEGASNFYDILTPLAAGSEFTVTLDWFRERTFDPTTNTTADLAQADLDLFVRNLTTGELIAESVSTFNEVEHLSFQLATAGLYQIEVNYFEDLFDVNGTHVLEEYGLAWFGTAVPEPGTLFVLLGGGAAVLLRRRAA